MKNDIKLQYIRVYTIFDHMLFSYTSICKYMKNIQACTTIYEYILVYTNMIILIHGVGIPDIWNPDHLDKNWQNGTYVSEHGTDMYIDVHAFTYRHAHVCTWYVHVHKYM
jgi:hypothetical protein